MLNFVLNCKYYLKNTIFKTLQSKGNLIIIKVIATIKTSNPNVAIDFFGIIDPGWVLMEVVFYRDRSEQNDAFVVG